MKISQNLPQFDQKLALLIVAGTYEADFYTAANGDLDKIDTFIVEKNDPAIPVGFIVAESGGDEHLKKMREAEFLKTFKKHLSEILKKQSSAVIHLFAPAEILKVLVAALPVSLQKNLHTHEGNFHNSHPFKLLEKIGHPLE